MNAMSMKPAIPRTTGRSSGFTLVELMIVVLVVAVLAAIALTSYQRQVVETRRTAATACLIEAAQRMERHFTSQMTYVGATLADVQCRDELADFYTFAVANQAQRTFRIEATAIGVQASRDGACPVLAMDQRGQRFVGATAGGGACW